MIQNIDSIADVRSVFEIDVLREKRGSAMNAIRLSGKVFGKVGMRQFTGGRYNCREVSRWEFNPQTLKEAQTFRNKREASGKHITQFVPCATAPVETRMSFQERNYLLRTGRRYVAKS